MTFSNFEDCKNHVIKHIIHPTPCREKLLSICEWLFTMQGVKCYVVDEPGIRFYINIIGGDHFFCIKYRKKCAEVHFYTQRPRGAATCGKYVFGRDPNKLPDYMGLVGDNKRWIRMSGKNFDQQSLETIKEHILESYKDRFNQLPNYGTDSVNLSEDIKKQALQNMDMSDEINAKLNRLRLNRLRLKASDACVEYAKRLANGICQDCKQPAPFVNRLTNEPFLETHHITPLAQGGSDTIENIIAICPNCHRKRHYG